MDSYIIRTSQYNKTDVEYFTPEETKEQLMLFGTDSNLISTFLSLNKTDKIFTNLFKFELVVCFDIPSKVYYAMRLK